MNRGHDVSFIEAWQKMPAARRHIYFFTLLALVTVVVANFQEYFAAVKRLLPEPSMPPRITSQEVYPAPVNF